MNGKKLLFVVNVDWFFVSHRLPIAIAASKSGWEVHIACALTDKAELLKSHGFIVHDLPISRKGTELYSEFCAFIKLFKVIKLVKPDLAHFITIKPVIYGGIASRLNSLPAMVASISGLGYVFMADGIKAEVRKCVVSFLYKIALAHKKINVIFQNPDDKQLLMNIGAITEKNSVMIRGSGVDLNAYCFLPEREQTPVVVLLARMLRDKGVVEFVKAAEKIKEKGIPARFLLVGDVDSNPTSISESEINIWVKCGFVEWLGYRSDVNQLLQGVNLVVLPSYREGLPKTLIEAAACGRAVITTDVPGCRDAIEVGETGLLVPPRDSDALAVAIEKLLTDANLRQQMGSNGRVLAENYFSINSVISKHLEIYNHLVQQ